MSDVDSMKLYKQIYPNCFQGPFFIPPTTYALNEVKLRPCYSNVVPHEVDLSCEMGPIKMKIPLFSAAMDTVSEDKMAKALSDMGGCAVIWRTRKEEDQLKWLAKALNSQSCLITNPKCLYSEDAIEDAREILDVHGFSTIPVVTRNNILKGILFTRDIAFKKHLGEPVKKWMMPISKLKIERVGTSFEKIKNRLLNEQECSVLPVLNEKNKLVGMYFMKDFVQINPATHNGKPLVGMAVSIHESDLDRVREGLRLGVGAIAIDSSHGNCLAVIKQTEKIVKITDGRAAIIAGNVASIDGYLRLAQAGADIVKAGIGSGSICTTSNTTGAGVGMFSLGRELSIAREVLLKKGKRAPFIMLDGSINGPSDFVLALATGAHSVMAGKWLVAASESASFQKYGAPNNLVYYRGMASKAAIKARSSVRYGKQKRAAEGVEGYVEHRGPLKRWIDKDMELIKGGFAHVNAKNIEELHAYCSQPMVFSLFTSLGQTQNETRVIL